jgi:hypothetical protein
MLNVNELTIAQVKEIQGLLGAAPARPTSACPYEVGRAYLIRTVTHYHVGRLVEVTPKELVLEDASWIADTGRFNKALATGTLNEVEPFPVGRVIVGRGALVDAALWNHALPRTEK